MVGRHQRRPCEDIPAPTALTVTSRSFATSSGATGAGSAAPLTIASSTAQIWCGSGGQPGTI
ncbi:MAG TPA: hypothetical protein VF897_07600 [Roseiflexaceae bacterium]